MTKENLPKNDGFIIDKDEVHLPIIADEVNEDWLERKMLCLLSRYHLLMYVNSDQSKIKKIDNTCENAECPFCFPEKPKTDRIPDVGKMIEENRAVKAKKCPKCSENMYECNEVKLSQPPKVVYRCAKCDDEKPLEKVTVNEVLDHIADFYTYLHSDAIYSMRNLDPLALVQITHLKYAEMLNAVKQKLEYLVSLQEKS